MGTNVSTQRGGQAGASAHSGHSAKHSAAAVQHASPAAHAHYMDEHALAKIMEQARIAGDDAELTGAPISDAEPVAQLSETLLVHTAAPAAAASRPQPLANNSAVLNQQRGGNEQAGANKKKSAADSVTQAQAAVVPRAAAASGNCNENDAGSHSYAAPATAASFSVSSSSTRASLPTRPLPRQASAMTLYRTHAIHPSKPAAPAAAKGVFREPTHTNSNANTNTSTNTNTVVLVPAAHVSKLESIPPPPVARANSVTEAPAAAAAAAAPAAADSLPPPCMASSVSASSRLSSPPKRSAFARSFASQLTLSQERPDIVHYLQDREITLAVSPDYMRLQPELNYRMREILIDWLQGVSYRFRLKSESIMLCVNILDRFLCARECARDRFQLVGITCLILAAKYEESSPPSIEDFLIITDRAFERRAVLHMESVILSALSFEVTLPCIRNFSGSLELLCPLDALVDSIRAHPSQAALSGTRDIEGEFRSWVAYFSLACLQHSTFLSYSPSMIAGAVVALAHFQIQVEAACLSRGIGAEDEEGLPYWDALLRDASGGYDVGEFSDVWAELRLILDPACFVPGEARYEAVTKRFQREAHHAVACKRVVFPKSL